MSSLVSKPDFLETDRDPEREISDTEDSEGQLVLDRSVTTLSETPREETEEEHSEDPDPTGTEEVEV